MPSGIKVCKVCGKEYLYCKTENRSNRFRYQDVACCPEHGSIYFAEIAKSRGEVAEVTKPARVAKASVKAEPKKTDIVKDIAAEKVAKADNKLDIDDVELEK